jgi:hypothetical protein
LLPFYSARKYCQYQINENDGISYGLGLAHMMIALNCITLKSGDILWHHIFNNSKMPREDERNYAYQYLKNK